MPAASADAVSNEFTDACVRFRACAIKALFILIVCEVARSMLRTPGSG
jgi:hypothetical protein